MADDESFFSSLGRRFGSNIAKMRDPNSPGNRGAARNRKAVKKAYGDLTTGFAAGKAQRSAGLAGGQSLSSDQSPYIFTGQKKPEDFQGAGSAGYNPGIMDRYTDVAKRELGNINAAPGSPYGYGTKGSPFTGTASKPSGFFGAENSAEYAENTDNGRYVSGYNELGRGAALADLYRPEQMAQVAANERTSDAYLAGLDRKKEMTRLRNFERGAVRGRPGFRKLSQRRRSDQALGAADRMSELNKQANASALARGAERVGMAQAVADQQRALAGTAKAQADIYGTDVKAGVELSKLEQQGYEYDTSRYTSSAEQDAHVAGILQRSDFPQSLINDGDFMAKLRMEVARGADPETQARLMMAQMQSGLGE